MTAVVNLVGRQAELSQLIRVLTEDTERAVLLGGEPGIGKTTLADQMCAHAAANGWRVIRVLGVQAEQSYSLGGLNRLVLSLQEFLPRCATADRVVLKPVLGGDAASAVAVLPLATALLSLLAVAAQKQPVLLVLDDVHWLDDVSAEVLAATGRRLANPRLRMVAVRRTPNESAFCSAGWTELTLAPLNDDESAKLLECAGVPITAATRHALLAAAAGNPLALVELPRFAGLSEYSSASMPLTDRLVAAFGARLNQLSADVRAELLRAALDGISGNSTMPCGGRYVMRNVEAAVSAGLLVANPLGPLAFRHPLVLAAVIHQSTSPQRRDAHRDLAGLYDDVLVRRAGHLAAAATEPDQEVADVLARAARLTARRGGLSVAAEWLRRAAELSTEPDQRAQLVADAVFIAARAGRLSEAQSVLETVGTGEGNWALTVLADCYRAFHTDGEGIYTHRRLVETLTRADALDDRTVNRLANLLLSITNSAGDTERREQTNKVLADLEARLNPMILTYRMGLEDIARTARAVQSMLTRYTERIPRMTAQQVILLSFPAYCVDAMAEFRAPLQQAFTTLSRHGASIDAVEGGRVVMLDLIAAGHWEQAEQVGSTCLEMSQQAQGSALVHHELLADLGMLAASLGDRDTARRYAAEVVAWAKPRGLNALLDDARRITVRVALAEADYQTAYQSAIAISPPGKFLPHNVEVGADMLDLVTAATLAGHTEQASMHVAEALRLRIHDFSPRVAALVLAVSAMTAPDAEADGIYRSALRDPGVAEFPVDRARIALAHGMWLRRMRRYTEARAALESAAEGFDRLGAQPWADRARAELRASGATVKQSRGETGALSAQERRIADLAASGKTNREIAAQLSLSPRTVGAHLSRAFRKLGITKRAALSQVFLQQDSEPNPTSEDLAET